MLGRCSGNLLKWHALNRSKAILNKNLTCEVPWSLRHLGVSWYLRYLINLTTDTCKASLMYYISLPPSKEPQSPWHCLWSCNLIDILVAWQNCLELLVRCPKWWFNEWWCTMKVNSKKLLEQLQRMWNQTVPQNITNRDFTQLPAPGTQKEQHINH